MPVPLVVVVVTTSSSSSSSSSSGGNSSSSFHRRLSLQRLLQYAASPEISLHSHGSSFVCLKRSGRGRGGGNFLIWYLAPFSNVLEKWTTKK